ncbi:MAG: hypothetical protein ABI595_11320 [Actinomycetota bacterium]
MTKKAQWLVGIAVVAGVLSIGVGFAVAGEGGAAQGSVGTSGGMMGGSTIGTGMMDPSDGGTMGGTSDGMMGSGSMVGGGMGAGMASMMAGVDMDAMHEQMMAALSGTVPSDVLARCDALHDQMSSSDIGTDGVEGSGHSAHHGNSASTG